MTLLFLATCVAVSVVANWDRPVEDGETLVQFGAADREHVWTGEVWRLVTTAFVHVEWTDLVWNVVTMLAWRPPMERRLGSTRFAALYLGAAIGSSALRVFVDRGAVAGASGAGFGIVGAHVVLAARRTGTWRAFVRSRRARRTTAAAIAWARWRSTRTWWGTQAVSSQASRSSGR